MTGNLAINGCGLRVLSHTYLAYGVINHAFFAKPHSRDQTQGPEGQDTALVLLATLRARPVGDGTSRGRVCGHTTVCLPRAHGRLTRPHWLSAARAGQRHTPRAASRGKKLTPTGFVATRLALVQSAMQNDA